MSDNVDILLIEDDANIAEALRFILSRAGWQVAHLLHGIGAVDAVRNVRPRLVVLDLMLPGRSGAEILAKLRADAELSATPVLMLTARGQAQEMAPGADAYLAKPFANDELREVVARMLG